MNLGLGSLEEIAATLTAHLGKVDLSAGCLLVQRSTPAIGAFPDAEATHRLADGSLVVVTGSLVSAGDMIAMALGERWAPWLREHHDPRGVRMFSEASLDGVRACKDYESAVACTGERGSWLTPTTMDEWIAARAARSAAFLAGD